MFGKVKFFITTLGVVISLFGATMSAHADTQVYLYQNGVPVLAPDCVIQDHNVYEYGNLIGTLDADDNIDNAEDVVIGYVTSDS